MVQIVPQVGYGQATRERRAMGGRRAVAPADATGGNAGAPTGAEPGGADGHHLRAQDGAAVGVLPAGTGLLWHDLVAAAACLAGGGRVGAPAPRAAPAPGGRREDR